MLFCILQCTEQWGHFFGEWPRGVLQKVPITLRRKTWRPVKQHGLHSLDIPLLWLVASARAVFLLNILLASPLPPPPPHCLGNKGRGTSACIAAWPGTGLCSLTPRNSPCYSWSRQWELKWFPTGTTGHSPKAWTVPVYVSIWQDQSMLLKWVFGIISHHSALPGVSWSSLVINMIGSFPSCR